MSNLDVPKSVFHYTSATGLMGILNSRQLWLSDIGFLNDAEEMRYAAQTIIEKLKSVIHQKFGDGPPLPGANNFHRHLAATVFDLEDRFNNEPLNWVPEPVESSRRHQPLWEDLPFVASFCSEGDLLSMWRGYADGDGFAIEFDTAALLDAAQGRVRSYDLTEFEQDSIINNNSGLNVSFAPIVYGPEGIDSTLGEALKEMAASTNDHVGVAASHLVSRMIPSLATVKHPAFTEEREVRLIAFPTGDLSPRPMLRWGSGYLVPYLAIEFPHSAILSIRVGPASHRGRSREALERFFRYGSPRGEYGHIRILSSEAPLV